MPFGLEETKEFFTCSEARENVAAFQEKAGWGERDRSCRKDGSFFLLVGLNVTPKSFHPRMESDKRLLIFGRAIWKSNCQGQDFIASVVQKDEGNDLAVLRVEDADAGVSLSFSDSVKLGAQVFTMGFPHPDLQGSDVKFTTGSISGLTGLGNTPVYYQISAPTQSGNSGGPLFDEYGNLVGIVAAKLDSLKMLAATGDLTQNVNYAIKSDYLVPILKTVDGIKIQPSKTNPANLLVLVEELKKSVVMIKVY